MFQLYRSYANRDRAQGKNKSAWLTNDLTRNLSTPVQTPTFSKSLTGVVAGDRGQLYRVCVMQADRGRTPQVRQSLRNYFVTYERLSPILQRP
jgi:phycocyanin-associated rod linker protein